MEKLYMKTSQGIVPIETEMIEKYKLKKGDMSPFSRVRVADEYGNNELDVPQEKNPSSPGLNTAPEDGIVQLDNGFNISQSEIIDFSQGVDSSDEDDQ